MKLSVVSASYNRAPMVNMALCTYAQQSLPFDEWEYLFVDDMSDDNTKEVVEKWQKAGLPIVYVTAEQLGLPKEPGKWRDGCTIRNRMSLWAKGDVIVVTHPEIAIPPNALEVMYNTVMENHPKTWVTAIPYWMPGTPISDDSWVEDLFRLTQTPGFYSDNWPDPVPFPDYRNQNQERRDTWESEVFFGMRNNTWRWMGGFRNFEVWGSVDVDFNTRRAVCKIKTVIAKGSPVPSGNLMVFHLYHESKRDMSAAMNALKGANYPTELAAREAGGIYEKCKDISFDDPTTKILVRKENEPEKV